MNITQNHRSLILNALRKNDVNKGELAETLGYGKAWTTKLLNGTLKTISDGDARKIEKLLGIRLVSFVENETTIPPFAIELAKCLETHPEVEPLMSEILKLTSEINVTKFTPRYFDTKEMPRLGNEIIRLCFENEDKPGKVAREVLKLVSE